MKKNRGKWRDLTERIANWRAKTWLLTRDHPRKTQLPAGGTGSKLVWNGNLSACHGGEEGCEERWRVGKLGPLRGFYGGPTDLWAGICPLCNREKGSYAGSGLTKSDERVQVFDPPKFAPLRYCVSSENDRWTQDDLYDAYVRWLDCCVFGNGDFHVDDYHIDANTLNEQWIISCGRETFVWSKYINMHGLYSLYKKEIRRSMYVLLSQDQFSEAGERKILEEKKNRSKE